MSSVGVGQGEGDHTARTGFGPDPAAELFDSRRKDIEGVVVVLPNFGDEKGVADTMRLFIDIARKEYNIDHISYAGITSYSLSDCLDMEEKVMEAILCRIQDGVQIAWRGVVAMGARVIALDVSDERLELAKGFGADEVINAARNNDMVDAIRTLTRGEGAHKTLDCSSAPEARAAAVRALGNPAYLPFIGLPGKTGQYLYSLPVVMARASTRQPNSSASDSLHPSLMKAIRPSLSTNQVVGKDWTPTRFTYPSSRRFA